MNHQVLYIGGTRLPIPRSVSAPVLLSSLSIKHQKTTESGALADQHVPQTDDLETDESSQEDEPVMTPPITEMDRCGLFEQWDNKPSLFSDCGVTEGNEKPKPGCELRAICSRTYGSGQHFRLAHEYAESAREAAQVQLRLMVASLFGSGATYYPTAHAYYYSWAMNVMNWQNHYMYAQIRGDLFETREAEIWNELGWESGARNKYYIESHARLRGSIPPSRGQGTCWR